MVSKTTRRGKRVLVIDFSFTKSDGSPGRYRRDAELQTMEGARAEERRRMMAVAKTGSPFEAIDDAARALAAPAPPPELTFAEVVDRFESEYAPRMLAEATRNGYQSRLRNWILPQIGSLPVSAVNKKVVADLDTALVVAGASDCVRRGVFITLRSVLTRFAVEAEILKFAPSLPKLPKAGDRVVEVPIPEEFARVIDAARYPEYRVAFLLAGHAGLRRGEIRALRCRDVDFEGQGRIIVRLSKYKHDTDTPKSGHEREIPMTPALRQALLDVGADRRPKDAPVALNTRGKPWGQKGLWDAFTATLKRMDLDHSKFHALRHFFVTAMLRGGVSPHVVQKLAGHADLATTQRYAHLHGSDRVEAVGALAATYAGRAARVGSPERAGEASPPRPRARQRRGNGSERAIGVAA